MPSYELGQTTFFPTSIGTGESFSPSKMIHYICSYIKLLMSCQSYDWMGDLDRRTYQCTVGQNNQKCRLKYWATRSSIHPFARTAHSFHCSSLFASLAPSAALTRSLAYSLCSLPGSWESEFLMSQNDLVLFHSGMAAWGCLVPPARIFLGVCFSPLFVVLSEIIFSGHVMSRLKKKTNDPSWF